MGTHPSHTQADHENGTRPTPPVGPRVAAARSRRKRTLILASATSAALLVGGTATATVITANTTTPQATGIPDADTDPLVADDATPRTGQERRQSAEDAVTAATQNSSADASDIPEQQEDEEDTEPPQEDSTSEDGEESNGQGGACEASFYGTDFAGSTTANGETFDPNAMTAAHKTLPFDTQVQVTNPSTGQSVTVRINDRGPYVDGRCLDLSTAAFDQLVGTGAGVAQVEWQVVG